MFLETGARKKKSLTEPVTFIPFPGQNLRDKQTQKEVVQKQSVPLPSSSQVEKPEPKILQTAGNKLISTNLSIKRIKTAQKEEGAMGSLNADLPIEDFTIDEVNMFWRQFASRMKDEGKETFYNAMIKRNPKSLSETLFQFEVDNQVQVDVINSDIERLTTFLRSSLKNYDFTLELRITENQLEDVKHLTGKDKYTLLSRKFPNLHLLKSTFNLDIEY